MLHLHLLVMLHNDVICYIQSSSWGLSGQHTCLDCLLLKKQLKKQIQCWTLIFKQSKLVLVLILQFRNFCFHDQQQLQVSNNNQNWLVFYISANQHNGANQDFLNLGKVELINIHWFWWSKRWQFLKKKYQGYQLFLAQIVICNFQQEDT